MVGGVTLVELALEIASQAQRAGLVEDVVVSTDDTQIEQVVRLRTRCHWRGHTLDATSTVRDVAVEFLNRDEEPWELVVILLPTSPLRTLRTVVESYRLMAEHNFAHPVLTAVRARKPPSQMFLQDIEGLWQTPYGGTALNDWRIHEGGCIWTKPQWLREDKTFYDRPCLIQEVPPEEAVDVDTELDLVIAEALLRRPAP